ncbi:hypothetical protein SLA2020_504970 [Shorea laevis]
MLLLRILRQWVLVKGPPGKITHSQLVHLVPLLLVRPLNLIPNPTWPQGDICADDYDTNGVLVRGPPGKITHSQLVHLVPSLLVRPLNLIPNPTWRQGDICADDYDTNSRALCLLN